MAVKNNVFKKVMAKVQDQVHYKYKGTLSTITLRDLSWEDIQHDLEVEAKARHQFQVNVQHEDDKNLADEMKKQEVKRKRSAMKAIADKVFTYIHISKPI